MIEATDIVTYLNPEGSATKFQSAPVIAGVNKAIEIAKANVQGYMSEDYRRIQRTIPGLVLSRYSAGEETEFTLPSWIVASSVTVWKNLEYVWRDRRRQETEEVAFDAETNTITLSEASEEGDSYVCEVVHDSPYPPMLKSLCLKLAVGELVQMLPRLVGPEDRELFTNDMNNARVMLSEMRRGMIRIDEWDELKLIDENETITGPGTGLLYPDGW